MSWERAQANESGLPEGIVQLLEQHSELRRPRLVIGTVEHKVVLPHGQRPSQNDVWAIVGVGGDLLSLTVEAKAGEPFGDLVSVWLERREPGSDKPARLKALQKLLGIPDKDATGVRYQLLHRTASAIIEAERIGAKYAAMIVQSFRNGKRISSTRKSLDDFKAFGRLFGFALEEGRLVRITTETIVPMYLGWVTCDPATDSEVAALRVDDPAIFRE